MKKNVLIIGVNSTIGTEIFNQLKDKGKHQIYSTSRSPFDNYAVNHQILMPQENELNKDLLPDEIHELYYILGSINLKPFKSLKKETYLTGFSINVLGFNNVLKTVNKQLVAGKASVLAFSSVVASLGLQYRASVSVCKGALEGFIKAMAAEYAGIMRFNASAISLSNTKMAERFLNSETKEELAKTRNPLKAIGEPEKIGKFATIINDNDCNWLSGEIIHFDGGMKNLKTF